MKSRNITIAAVALIALCAVVLFGSARAQAQSATGTAMRDDRTAKADLKAVEVRVQSLNKLMTRVQTMRNVPESQKTTIASSIQQAITMLNDIKAKIQAATSSEALAVDHKTIVETGNIHALIMPRLSIFAAADRIMTITVMMTTVGTKLQSRVAEATDIEKRSDLEAALTDYNAKLASAKAQANAAVELISPLVPDAGDKVRRASNLATMKDARAKIQAAQKDLVAARKDADLIIKALGKRDKAMLNMKKATSTPPKADKPDKTGTSTAPTGTPPPTATTTATSTATTTSTSTP